MRRLQIASALALLAVVAAAPYTLRARSADAVPSSAAMIESLAEQGEGLAITQTDPATGRAVFAAAKGQGILLPVAEADPAADRASVFVDLYGQAFGLQGRAEVRLSRAPRRDALGFEHVKFQQLHMGVPVAGGEFIVHLKGTRAMGANGRILDRMPADMTPTLGASEAREVAREVIAGRRAAQAPGAQYREPRLEVFNPGFLEHQGGAPSRLAWFVEATGVNLREFIWIDARTGALLLAFSQLDAALNRQVYNANGTSTLPGTLARSEGGAPTGVPDVDNAYVQSGRAYNYFFTNHGRDSYNGAGASIVSTVNWTDGVTCPNAFWNGTQLVFCNGVAGLEDIVGHEFTHAVTEHEANFLALGLSAALRESYSDIFGETIDLLNGSDPPGDRWYIGEGFPLFGVRNMMNPNEFSHPGRVSDQFFSCGAPGGAQFDGGVPNHAYALMVDGGTFSGRTIPGIGLAKAGAIQYRALTTYLTSSSDFVDNFNALDQSCSDLIGTSGITSADCAAVTNALLAVEMNSSACSGFADFVPLCPAGGNPTYTFREGFETGAPGWTVSPASPARWGLQSLYVDAGAFSARGLAPGVTSDHSFVSPSFVVPAGGRMMFRHAFEFNGLPDFTGFVDGGVLEYTTNGGTTWKDALFPEPPVFPNPPSPSLGDRGLNYSGFLSDLNPIVATSYSPRPGFVLSNGTGFQPTRLNLAPIAGQTVRFRWRIGTIGSVVTNGWFLDQVDVYSCTVPAGAPAITVQPVGQTVPLGGTATLTVTAAGNPTLRYQWLRNGFPVPGATSSTLTITNVQGSDLAYYSVIVSNDAGTATSDVARVFLGAGGVRPLIMVQPAGKTITDGQTAILDASVQLADSFQWQLSTDGGGVWGSVPNAPPYSGGTTSTLTIAGATIGLNNTLYRLTATNQFGTSTSRSAVLNVLAANLITNGTFATGDTAGWAYFDNPGGTGEHLVSNGEFWWNRPGSSATQSVLFQNTGAAISGTPLGAQFDLGNSANIRQRVSVLMIDSDFSDLSVCTFWLAPAAPMRTYRMRTHTNKAWANASIYFYAATTANSVTNGGYLRLDNVSMNYNPTGSDLRTECEDPTSPAPPGGADSATLLTNGNFAGGMAGWSTFGVITSQVSNGVFEYIRPSPGPATPAGVVFQATGAAVAANEFLTATFDLGNSSAARKRVTALILSNDFSDLAACTFWLPPNLPLSTYQMKARATKAWAAGAATGAALYFYAATVGSDRWIRVDNAVLKRTPSAGIIGTECLEPVEVLKPPSFTAFQQSNVAAAPERVSASGGFAPASASGATEAFAPPRFVVNGHLRFFSSFDGPSEEGDVGLVQVSLDGITWQTLAEVPPAEAWTEVDVDLSEYAGLAIHVRFVPRSTGGSAVWRVTGLRVTGR